MSDIVEVVCPNCGYHWQEDLDWHRDNESIHTVHPGPRPRAGAETFHFRCPQDGTWVTVPGPDRPGSGRASTRGSGP